MGNDIEIKVKVSDDTGTGIAAVNTSLQTLKTKANEAGNKLESLATKAGLATVALEGLKVAADGAGDSLRDLRRRAEAAGNSMRDLRDGTTGTNNSLRTLNTRAQTANTRLGDLGDRTRTLRSDTDDLDGSMRRLTGTLGGMRGSLGTIRTSSGSAGGSMQRLKMAALALSPALIPIAAAAVPLAAGLGAAGIAVGVFGAAMLGQLVAVKNAADAETKYTEAVKKHGPASKQAADAEAAYLDQVRQMDPATRRTAAALGVLKDQYKGWSKSLAGDTMPVATKGLAVFGALMPKLTPVVKGASGELSRFMTILGGGINSAGFGKFMDSFAKFSTGALSKANDGLVRFMRTMSGGAGSSQFTEFMGYVKQVGPQVGETLANLARALVHVVAAASETGAGLLTVVNAFAKLVNALPTGVLSSLLQFALVMKTVRLAAVGLGATGGGLTRAATAIGAMRTAAAGASGGLGRMSAAFGALSTGAKFGAIGAGLGILVVGLVQLSKYGKAAPPDVDKLTTSLGRLGSTGQTSGEGLRLFGKNMDDLYGSLRNITDPTTTDKVQQALVKVFSLGIADSSPNTDAKKKIDAIDDSLTNLVRGGKTDIAASAFEKLSKAYAKGGGNVGDLKKKLDGYRKALDDQKFEAELAAQSMGLFGDQALAVQTKLDAQKASADGLRGAIQALNEANRAGLGGMIGFEAAVDAAAKAAKDNAGALSMHNGVLDLNSAKAQAAAGALQDLADKTDAAGTSQREAGASWETVNGVYTRGRAELIKNAEAMGLTKEQAKALAGQLLQIPTDVTPKIRMDTEDAKRDIDSFNAAVKKTPGAKSVTLKALSKSGEQVLESFGLKVKRLPDGSVKVTTKGGALSAINNIAAALRRLDGKTANTWTFHNIKTNYSTSRSVSGGKSVHDMVGATGGLFTGRSFRHGYADGGKVTGPGTGTSDDVFAPWLSNGEFVMKKTAVDRYGEKFLQRLNAGEIDMPRFAKGGKVTQAEKDARGSLRGQFGISGFGRAAGYHLTPFEKSLGAPSDMGSLVSSLNQTRGEIKGATRGGTESRLLHQLDSVGRGLIKAEKSLGKVTASLDKAKSKLDDLKNSASQLSSSVKGGVLSSANITKGGAGGTVTVASIMGGLVDSRDKASAFAGALSGLKSKGLDKSLIQQIGEAGIDGGGLETAGALLGASSSEISSVNSLQSQISKSATAAGKTTADAVYAGAIKAQQKLVDGLKGQQAKLEKAMANLAKVMEKSISKAIGRKAPGGIVGAAASGGLRGGMTWVGEHEPELLDLPVGSRVWSGPDSRRKAAAGGGGPAHVVLEINSSGSRYDEFLLQELRRVIRVRGGNVQMILAGRPA